jgi:hypothetical protein
MIASLSKEQTDLCLSRLREKLDSLCREVLYLNLGDVKTVRILCCHPDAAAMVRRQLAWSITSPVEEPDATLYFWEEAQPEDFHRRVLNLNFDREEGDDFLMLVSKEEGKLLPFAEFTQNGAVRIWKDNTYFFSAKEMTPQALLVDGHLFVQQLYRIADTPSTNLIHGACIGLEGSGILLCARGSRGKSTLTVTAMLRGFDYVADDYLLLEKENDTLTASPLYSIISLSPKMYNTLYDDLDKAHFVSISPWKDKYILDVSAYEASVQRHYPIRACVFPEIVPDAEPSVLACTAQEKGRAITHMIHSTVAQMNDQGNTRTVRKLVEILNGLDFYRIRLSPDIFLNAECLRQFIKHLNP